MLDIDPRNPPTEADPFKLSPSSVRLYQSCPRKFAYRYHYGIEGKLEPADKLKFGTAVHRVI